MPLIKFRSYTAGSRKRNMIAFGMYQQNASADLDVIEDVGSGQLGCVDSGDHANFTLSAVPSATNLVVVRRGLIQRSGAGNDYTLAGNVLTLAVPVDPSDPLDDVMAFAIGGA